MKSRNENLGDVNRTEGMRTCGGIHHTDFQGLYSISLDNYLINWINYDRLATSFTLANAPVPGLELCSIGQGPEKWALQLLDSEEF